MSLNKTNPLPEQEHPSEKLTAQEKILNTERNDLQRTNRALEAVTSLAEGIEEENTDTAQEILEEIVETETEIINLQQREFSRLGRILGVDRDIQQYEDLSAMVQKLKEKGLLPQEQNGERATQTEKDHEIERQTDLRMYILEVAASSPEKMERYTRSRLKNNNQAYLNKDLELRRNEQRVQRYEEDIKMWEQGTYREQKQEPEIPGYDITHDETAFEHALRRNTEEIKTAMQDEERFRKYARALVIDDMENEKAIRDLEKKNVEVVSKKSELQLKHDSLKTAWERKQEELRNEPEEKLKVINANRLEYIKENVEGEEREALTEIVNTSAQDNFLEKLLRNTKTDDEREKAITDYSYKATRKISNEVGFDVPSEVIRQELRILAKEALDQGIRGKIINKPIYPEEKLPDKNKAAKGPEDTKKEKKQVKEDSEKTEPKTSQKNKTQEPEPIQKPKPKTTKDKAQPQAKKEKLNVEPEVVERNDPEDLGSFVRMTLDREGEDVDRDMLFKAYRLTSGSQNRADFNRSVETYLKSKTQKEAPIEKEPEKLNTFIKGILNGHITTNSLEDINYRELYKNYVAAEGKNLTEQEFIEEAKKHIDQTIDQRIESSREQLLELGDYIQTLIIQMTSTDKKVNVDELYNAYLRFDAEDSDNALPKEEFKKLVQNALSKTLKEGRKAVK